MPEFFALLFIFIVAILGMTFGINFFWRINLTKSLGIAAFFATVTMLFWASGIWQNASRHSWGILTPIFVIMLAGAWLAIKFGKKFWKLLQEKLEK